MFPPALHLVVGAPTFLYAFGWTKKSAEAAKRCISFGAVLNSNNPSQASFGQTTHGLVILIGTWFKALHAHFHAHFQWMRVFMSCLRSDIYN